MTQACGLDQLRPLPDPRNCPTVVDRGNVVGRIVEHQRRDTDLRSQHLVGDRFQHLTPKVLIHHCTHAIHNLVRQPCQCLKTRQRIQQPVEGAEIDQPRGRRELPFHERIGSNQSPKRVGDDRMEGTFMIGHQFHAGSDLQQVGGVAIRLTMRRLVIRNHAVARKQQGIDKACHLAACSSPAVHEQHRRTAAAPGSHSQLAVFERETIAAAPFEDLSIRTLDLIARRAEKCLIGFPHNALILCGRRL